MRMGGRTKGWRKGGTDSIDGWGDVVNEGW